MSSLAIASFLVPLSFSVIGDSIVLAALMLCLTFDNTLCSGMHAAAAFHDILIIFNSTSAEARSLLHLLQSFFTRWWREQTDSTKALVRKLVDRGQLDFVNGGYVQHDEAAAHYVAMIDQTTRGHRFVIVHINITGHETKTVHKLLMSQSVGIFSS